MTKKSLRYQMRQKLVESLKPMVENKSVLKGG